MPQDAALGIGIGRWWWLAVATFVIGLVALVPAALLERLIAPNTNMQFAADSGTIWSGRGRIRIATGTAPLIVPQTWRFAPGALFGLRLGFNIEPDSPVISGTTRIGLRFSDVELSNTALVADARLLTFAHQAAALFTPAGKVRLQQAGDERLRVRPATNTGEAWRVDGVMGLHTEQLAFGGIVNAQVGTHDITLLGDGPTIKLSVLRSSGPLKLEGGGTLALALPRRFTFSGFATAANDAPDALKQLGPLLPDGRQRIELNTNW